MLLLLAFLLVIPDDLAMLVDPPPAAALTEVEMTTVGEEVMALRAVELEPFSGVRTAQAISSETKTLL